MINLYYRIWVDCIVKLSSRPENASSWKWVSLLSMSMAMAMNFLLIMAILQRNILKTSFYHLEVNVFPGTKLDAFISFFILFLLPNLVINYWLIFRNDKYKKLIQKFEYRNGRRFFIYIFGTFGIWIILMLSIIAYKLIF